MRKKGLIDGNTWRGLTRLSSAGTTVTLYFVTDCFGSGPEYVTLSFRVTEDFDPSTTGDLFIKGQNGYNDGSTTCLSSNENCGPTTIVPEPITATLFATGVGLWGGVGYLRRRRRNRASDI